MLALVAVIASFAVGQMTATAQASPVTGLLNYIYTDLVDPTHSTTGTITAQLDANCALALRHWSWRDGTAWLAEEAEG